LFLVILFEAEQFTSINLWVPLYTPSPRLQTLQKPTLQLWAFCYNRG